MGSIKSREERDPLKPDIYVSSTLCVSPRAITSRLHSTENCRTLDCRTLYTLSNTDKQQMCSFFNTFKHYNVLTVFSLMRCSLWSLLNSGGG